MFWKEAIANRSYTDSANKKTVVELIAWKFGDAVAPLPPPDSLAADSKNEVAIWNMKLEPGVVFTLL